MTVSLRLPPPISVNGLYANVRGRGRVKSARYNTWSHHARALLMEQMPLPRVRGKVSVTFSVGEKGVSALMDGDNTQKAYLDALVEHGVIEGDSRKHVRAVGMEWVPGQEGAVVEITSLE